MLGTAMYTTIKTLKAKGLNKSEIARATGHDWKTVNKVMLALESGKDVPSQKPHPSRLDAHQTRIIEWLEIGLSGVRM